MNDMNMSKTKIIETIYPNHAELFSYDTALPLNLMRDILEKVFPNLQPMTEEYSEKYQAVYSAVYAYGKGPDRASGLIPLTQQARDIFSRYAHIVGYSVIFTPVIDPYQDAREKKYKDEYRQLEENYKEFNFSLSDYIQSRESHNYTFDAVKEMLAV